MALGGKVRYIRKAVGQVAEMLMGGLVIYSMRQQDQQQEIYAQTVIQLDGDVVTAYSPEVIASADFEALTARHMEKVETELEPLEKLPIYIALARGVLVGIGALGGLISIVSSFQFKDLLDLIWILPSALFVVSGCLVHRIVRKIAECQVKLLTDVAKREAEAHAREVLAKSQ
jgi:hypothetical protein